MFQVIQPTAHAKPQEATIRLCVSRGTKSFQYMHISTMALSQLGITLLKGTYAYIRFSYVSESRRMYINACSATDAGAIKIRPNHRILDGAIIQQFKLTYGDAPKVYLATKPTPDTTNPRIQWFQLNLKTTN